MAHRRLCRDTCRGPGSQLLGPCPSLLLWALGTLLAAAPVAAGWPTEDGHLGCRGCWDPIVS